MSTGTAIFLGIFAVYLGVWFAIAIAVVATSKENEATEDTVLNALVGCVWPVVAFVAMLIVVSFPVWVVPWFVHRRHRKAFEKKRMSISTPPARKWQQSDTQALIDAYDIKARSAVPDAAPDEPAATQVETMPPMRRGPERWKGRL